MNRLVIFISALVLFCGCDRDNPDWTKKARQTGRDTWSVSGIGADITVDLSGQAGWRIDGGYRGDVDKYIDATSPGELDCGWFYAWIPADGNRLEIWVGVNDGTTGERDARIDLSCGDQSRTVTLRQKDYRAVIVIDREYRGWDDVYNDLTEPVTILTLNTEDPESPYYRESEPHEIQPGESIRLYAGAMRRGESVREHAMTLITLSDGRQMRFEQGSPEAWSRAFYDSCISETVRERIKVSDCWVNNIYIIRVYRITPEIVALWE